MPLVEDICWRVSLHRRKRTLGRPLHTGVEESDGTPQYAPGMPEAPDLDDLVRSAQAGDRQAFHDLVVAAQTEVRLFAAARAPNLDLAEEAVQAGFVTAYERLHDYQPRGTFVPWVKGIVLNRLREELRTRRRLGGNDLLDQLLVEPAANASEEAIATTADEEIARLRCCLERLAPRARLMLARRYTDGLPVARLAQHFHQSEAAITGLLHRIRRSLRTCIETGRTA